MMVGCVLALLAAQVRQGKPIGGHLLGVSFGFCPTMTKRAKSLLLL